MTKEQKHNLIALLCVLCWVALSLVGAALVQDLDTQVLTITFRE